MRSARDPRRTKPQQVPTCKVRGDNPKNLHLSTRKPKKPVLERSQPPIQNPPQAELLAEEYVHNLQQQLYFLDAELRFLHDRSGVDDNPNGTSVDSAIRKLRRACAMHEEETNKKIEAYQRQIADKKKEIKAIDMHKAEEILEDADNHEQETIEQLKSAFIEMASKIHMHQLQKSHYDNASEFNENQRESMTNAMNEGKARREALEEELRKIHVHIEDIRGERKDLLNKFNVSIMNKRMHEEEADLLVIIGNEEEQPPPNKPISMIKAQNAKIEKDLEAAKVTRDELEQQLDQLLEKNVRLKAELNDLNAKVDRAKRLKSSMDKTFQAKFAQVQAENANLQTELDQVKAQRREAKKNFAACNQKFDEFLVQINQCQGEQQLLSEVISFKTQEKQRMDAENDKTRAEIASVTDDVRQMREELDDLAKLIAEASEKHKKVETLVNINNEDPRCKMENVPPELAQLLDSLNAVNEKLD